MKKTMSLSLIILALYIVPAFSMKKKEGELVLSNNPHLKELFNAFSHGSLIEVANSDAWKRAQEFVPKKEDTDDTTPKKPNLIVKLHELTQQSIEVVTDPEVKEKVSKLDKLAQCIPTILTPAAQRENALLERQSKDLSATLESKQAQIKKLRDALTQACAEEKELKKQSKITTGHINDVAVLSKLLEEVSIKNKAAVESVVKALKNKIEELKIEKGIKEIEYNDVKPEDITSETNTLKENIAGLTKEITELDAKVTCMEKTLETFGQPPKGFFGFLS